MDLDISRYLLTHYVMLTELIGLLAMLKLGVHISKKTTDCTKATIILIVLESIAWTMEGWTQNHDDFVTLRFFLSACVYCLHPIIAVALIETVAPVKRHRILLFGPLAVYIPLMFTSQWTRLIYYISDDNHWHAAGDFQAYVPYIFFGAYAIAFMILFIAKYIRYSWSTIMGVVYIVVVSFMGVMVHLFKDSETDYATLFSSVIVLYYLFLNMHMSKTDSMTGLFNRQCFYHDTEKHRGRFSAICSADMNELKWINDTKGHEAGDAAIISVASCLSRDSGTPKNVYRVGGDEFVILYHIKSEDRINKDIEFMRKALAEAGFVCAFGYVMLDGKGSFDDALRDADKAMYTDKSNIKRAILEAGGELHRRAGDRGEKG